ncbi:response regulator [Vreelandella arcis]|uniref:Response regulator receiver domain-containing protein n=1 Tax=Vreelandella arcis TaxID=416873 RepID=A0A1G9X1A0_9GAMM|nr:response regulator [Halomonas arcis]SDM90482.1 Response regulator receiver domain-containing protein [Halomonas arcis]
MESDFTVLLVEDEPADVHLTRMAFKQSRLLVNVYDVGDGVEALAFLRREGKYHDAPWPDIILLDLNMPRMDGKTFLDHLKRDETLKRIPVIVLTTSEAETDVMDSYNLGCAGFVTKPVDLTQFLKAIQNVEDYWLTLVKRP